MMTVTDMHITDVRMNTSDCIVNIFNYYHRCQVSFFKLAIILIIIPATRPKLAFKKSLFCLSLYTTALSHHAQDIFLLFNFKNTKIMIV